MATQEWFVRIGEKTYGPHTADKLREAARAGKITPSTDVKKGRDGRWVIAEKVRGLEFGGDALWRHEKSEANSGKGACEAELFPTPFENTEALLVSGPWEYVIDTSSERCPITNDAGPWVCIEVAEHCPLKQSLYHEVLVSVRGAELHKRNKAVFWIVFDHAMRLPFSSVPLIGGNLQLAVMLVVAECFPICALIDLLQRRNPVSRGNIRFDGRHLLVRRTIRLPGFRS